jgi:cysteine/histidine-rich domain-containing protein
MSFTIFFSSTLTTFFGISSLAHLHFPAENINFDLDLELKGVVEVDACTCSMLGTKLEIKMKKAETGSWAKLDIPWKVVKVVEENIVKDMSKAEPSVDALELDDLDLTPTRMSLSKEAQMKPSYA